MQDRGIVTKADQYKKIYRSAPFSMTLNDTLPRCQGHAIIQRLMSLISLIPCFLSRVSTLMRDTDIAILSVRLSVCLSVRPSVRHVPVSDENILTYCHNVFTVR